MAESFAVGRAIVVRHVWRGRVFLVWTAVVAHDDTNLLALWIPPGAPCLRPGVRDALPYEQPLVERPWRAPGVLQLWARGAAHAIWLLDDAWYVNLQEPFRRRDDGVETADQLLDLVRSRDGRWSRKDEHELEAAVAGGFVSPEEAAGVHAEAERVIAADPFPTGWENWEPDPAWPLPTLPPTPDVP